MPIGTGPNADCGLSENAVSLEPFANVSTNARCIAIVVVWFVAQRFMCTHLANVAWRYSARLDKDDVRGIHVAAKVRLCNSDPYRLRRVMCNNVVSTARSNANEWEHQHEARWGIVHRD